MPRIDDQFLECSVYLYRTAEEAKTGENIGGTGFLVSVPSKQPGRSFHYFVSNKHVVFDGAATVVRLNTKDGKFDVL